MKKTIIAILTNILILSTISIAKENGYIVQDSYVLEKSKNGINGKIILQIDKNIPTDIPNSELEPDKYMHTTLQIIDSKSKIIDSRKFEYPIVWIEKKIYDGVTFYFLTIDEYIGMGSYSGKRTLLFQVKNGKIVWQTYNDTKTQENKDIILYNALKSSWAEVSNNKSISFNQIYCKPNFDKDGESLLIYVKYIYTNGMWKRSENMEAGYWETDHDFPDISKFYNKENQ